MFLFSFTHALWHDCINDLCRHHNLVLCNLVSLFYKKKQPCVICTGSVIRTLYKIGYRGLLNYNICIQIEFVTPWLRRWLNHFNNWLHLNIKRTAEMRLLDFFSSHPLFPHFPPFLLPSKQNINMNPYFMAPLCFWFFFFLFLYYYGVYIETNMKTKCMH